MSENDSIRKVMKAMSDASVLLNIKTMNIVYKNQAAKDLLQKYTSLQHLLSLSDIQQRIQKCSHQRICDTHELQMDSADFPQMNLSMTPFQWDNQETLMMTLSPCRAINSSTHNAFLQILEKEYFCIVEISTTSMSAQVLHARFPALHCKPHFPSIDAAFEIYANEIIHPSDKEHFLSLFSEERFLQYANGQPSPEITVRHVHNELYRWASYSVHPIDAETLLFLGKDVNEAYLNQERNEQFREELNSLTIRNNYILSGVSNIFRLMFHVDLTTGETVVCSAHNSFANVFDYDKVYQFEELTSLLLKLVHPDDFEKLKEFSSLKRLLQPTDESNARIMLEYRRISPQNTLNRKPIAKWTRSTIYLNKFENNIPQEAFYIVQDVHEQKIRDLETQIRTKSLSDRFYMLLQHRYLWFLDSDYNAQLTTCWKVNRDNVTEYMKCPFSRLFELVLIPFCHPEDIKMLAKLFLPDSVKKSFYDGQKKIVSEFRLRSSDAWRWVRIEMDLLSDEAGALHSLAYICDIDVEKQRMDAISRSEHEQLALRRKFGLSIQDVYARVGEIDLDADKIYHYRLNSDDYVAEPDALSFSKLTRTFSETVVHPEQRNLFDKLLSYPVIYHSAKENVTKIEHRFLLDLNHDHHYIWCNMLVRFFRDENGKSFAMALIQNIDDYVSAQNLQIQKLEKTRTRLQANLRTAERTAIRKAHIFSNIAADLKLALNQVSGCLNALSQQISEQTNISENMQSLEKSYASVTHMIEYATDIMMLENAQISLLSEKTELAKLMQAIKLLTSDLLSEKMLLLASYTTSVRNERVFCDFIRTKQLLFNVFASFIRCLPNGASFRLHIAQENYDINSQTAFYDFILFFSCDSSVCEQQRKLCSSLNDTAQSFSIKSTSSIEEMEQKLSLYICKKMIAMMNGSVKFTELQENKYCVTLRISLPYAIESECVFPQLLCFGKYTLIWEPDRKSAEAVEALLHETGVISHFASDFNELSAQLSTQHYDLLIVRQSTLNHTAFSMPDLQTSIASTPILILNDSVAASHTIPNPQISASRYIDIPLFRSTLATEFRNTFR